MPHYISLIKFTEKGSQAIKQSAERAHKFVEAAKKAGVSIDGQYWTTGAYDGVLILSAPKPEQVLRCLSELVSAGYVKTETLQAFTNHEFDTIVAG